MAFCLMSDIGKNQCVRVLLLVGRGWVDGWKVLQLVGWLQGQHDALLTEQGCLPRLALNVWFLMWLQFSPKYHSPKEPPWRVLKLTHALLWPLC